MMLIVIALAVGIIVGSVVSSKVVSSQWSKAYDKMSNELTNKCFDLTNKWCDSVKQSLELMGKVKDLTEQVFELEDELSDAKESLADHKVIFNNLEQDPECLSKAIKATDDLFEVITGNKCDLDVDTMLKFLEVDYKYDSVSDNYYNITKDEISVSLFCDLSDKQTRFVFDYLNNKYGISLKNNIRTHIMFSVLHELGHYVDCYNKKSSGAFSQESLTESYADVKTLEYGPECWKAYREVPAESFADSFAVNFIMKHFPELC